MTINFVEKLDDALLRAAKELFLRFLGGLPASEEPQKHADEPQKNAKELQEKPGQLEKEVDNFSSEIEDEQFTPAEIQEALLPSDTA
ncbi:Uu.00g137020.m01.CDS01 [Anthostomella pinea]|uniref:Uu.00g137020.m01.CDS01 n=1 Tax=Anthostomella pinea TaxID=933095 RepID=A0AAI8VPH0_9PEZI|nr:Uu.00g137020.m01.CDS01 [Anthostomella pinea]